MKMIFLLIIMEYRSAMLLCALYLSHWQGNAALVYLMDNLDDTMAARNRQCAAVVGDSTQHLVMGAFTEL